MHDFIRGFVVTFFIFEISIVVQGFGSEATGSCFLYFLVILTRLIVVTRLRISTGEHYVSIVFDAGINRFFF